MNLRDRETLYSTKEGEASSSSSRKWLTALKNPRIVRASRTFGGKDRHSKVTTIKGLRDRRIRLSVPTAIQLYDLQERLGLNQPSKVIDWLLDVTKDDIDDLPPLPAMPPVCFSPFPQSIHSSQGYQMSLSSFEPFIESNLVPRKGGININSSSLSVGFNNEDSSSIEEKLKYWDPKQQKIRVDTANSQGFAQNLFPIASGNNNNNDNNPIHNYYHSWEPSNLSLTQLGSIGSSSYNNDHHHQGNNSSNSSMFLSPSMANNPSLFPHQHASLSHLQVEDDNIRQMNRFHLSNNPFPSSMSMSHQPHLHQTHDHRQDKNVDNNPWK